MLATYSGAGSVQPLSLYKNVTKKILKELREGIWITRGTRYVSVDFALYNANVNLFNVVKLNFEFPPTGGIITEANFRTVKLLRYITREDYAIMGCEIVFAAFVLYYLIEEFIEIKKQKFEYIKSFWNCLDIFVIGVSAATVAFNVYKYIKVSSLLKGMLAEPNRYTDFSFLATMSKTFQNAAAITILAGSIKIFKYLSFNKTMSQLAGTLTRVWSITFGIFKSLMDLF